MSTEPLRPDAVETVIEEPDEQAVVAVVPRALWRQAGDIVELDDAPREARVLSSRLQLRRNEPARVLVVLDVPDAALPGGTTESPWDAWRQTTARFDGTVRLAYGTLPRRAPLRLGTSWRRSSRRTSRKA